MELTMAQLTELFSEATFNMGVLFIKDFAGRISTIEGVVPNVSQEGLG
jgi:hypothetical protein